MEVLSGRVLLRPHRPRPQHRVLTGTSSGSPSSASSRAAPSSFSAAATSRCPDGPDPGPSTSVCRCGAGARRRLRTRELVSRGAAVLRGPRREPWGLEEMWSPTPTASGSPSWRCRRSTRCGATRAPDRLLPPPRIAPDPVMQADPWRGRWTGCRRVRTFWTERHLGSLVTLRADGSPHVVPVGVTLRRRGSPRPRDLPRGARSRPATRRSAGSPSCPQVDGRRWSTLEGDAVVRTRSGRRRRRRAPLRAAVPAAAGPTRSGSSSRSPSAACSAWHRPTALNTDGHDGPPSEAVAVLGRTACPRGRSRTSPSRPSASPRSPHRCAAAGVAADHRALRRRDGPRAARRHAGWCDRPRAPGGPAARAGALRAPPQDLLRPVEDPRRDRHLRRAVPGPQRRDRRAWCAT
jgi:hypothetical protein